VRRLYVVEPGARVTREGERIRVLVGEQEVESVRADELAQVVVVGSAGLSTPAMQALLKAGAEVVLLTRNGRFLGRLCSGLSPSARARHCQYARLQDPTARLGFARRVVAGKIANQVRLLRRHQSRLKDPSVASALPRMRQAGADALTAADVDILRGLEGAAAAAYFGVFGRLLKAEGVAFERRVRRPPPDPVNILLSFGYTLLGNLVHAAVETAGLDPYLGALHELRAGRPSLVLDLLEELRPVVVDTAVLRAFNTRAMLPGDFVSITDDAPGVEDAWEREAWEAREAADGAGDASAGEAGQDGAEPAGPRRSMVLTRVGVKKWIACYERRLEEQAWYEPRGQRLSLREVAQAQAYRLARHFEGQEEYTAFESPE